MRAARINISIWYSFLFVFLSLVHNTSHSYAPHPCSQCLVLSGSEHNVHSTAPLISTCSYRGCGVVRKSVTMDVDDDFRLLLVVALHLRRKKYRRGQRSVWVCSIFTKWWQQGEYHQLFQEMGLVDPESHFRYLRMSKEIFDVLLSKIGQISVCNITLKFSTTDY